MRRLFVVSSGLILGAGAVSLTRGCPLPQNPPAPDFWAVQFAQRSYATMAADWRRRGPGGRLAADDGGLASVVSALAAPRAQGPLMHRVDLNWRQTPLMPTTEEAAGEAEVRSRALFASHETAELPGCGEGGEDGTAVVHRFRLADSTAAAALGVEAIRAAADGKEGTNVSNRAGSWHSRQDVLLPEGGWPEWMATALGHTVRDAVRLAWGAEERARARSQVGWEGVGGRGLHSSISTQR